LNNSQAWFQMARFLVSLSKKMIQEKEVLRLLKQNKISETIKIGVEEK